MDKQDKNKYNRKEEFTNENSNQEVILVLNVSHPVQQENWICEQQPEPRTSKAAELFEDISITPAFNLTLVELAKEGK